MEQLPTVIQDVRSFIFRDMSSRWDPADLLLGMGAITHPGHKSLSWLNVRQKDVIVHQLRTEMRNISAANDKEERFHESEEEEPAPAPKRCNVEEDEAFDVLFGKETSSVGLPQGSHVDIVVEELQRYQKGGEINFWKEDLLVWWEKNESVYPLVSKLAKKYLGVPASTAPSERVFSTAKNKLQKMASPTSTARKMYLPACVTTLK